MYAPGTIRASLGKLRGVLLRGIIDVDLSRSREYVAKVTPPKFSMEPEHDDFQKEFSYFQEMILRFHFKLQGCTSQNPKQTFACVVRR